jgi:hypothetical protein
MNRVPSCFDVPKKFKLFDLDGKLLILVVTLEEPFATVSTFNVVLEFRPACIRRS